MSISAADQTLDSFETWAQQYGPQVSAISAHKYKAACAEFARLFGHPIYADAATCRTWYESLRERHAPSTINVKISGLRAFFEFARERGIRQDFPLAGIRMQAIPERLPRPLIHNDVLAVIQHLRGRPRGRDSLQDSAIVECLYGSGLRRDEVGRLRLGNFLDRDQLCIIGKGDKERLTMVTDPQYEAVREWALFFHIDDEARVVQKAQGDDAAFWDLVRRRPEQALFVTHSGREAPDLVDPGHFVYTRWKKAAAATGVLGTPHRVRHSFGTVLRNGGVDLATIQEMYGHKDIRTTRNYTKLGNPGLLLAKAAHSRQRDRS